jgi:hypothetical protein
MESGSSPISGSDAAAGKTGGGKLGGGALPEGGVCGAERAGEHSGAFGASPIALCAPTKSRQSCKSCGAFCPKRT